MKLINLNKLWRNELRLIDVFFLGPLQIVVSTYIPNIFFKYFLLITGILNILFNGHNFLLINKTIKNPILFFKPFINKIGKSQLHRLYNLIVMYPIFLYSLLFYKLPYYLYKLFLLNIVIGFLFNLYFFCYYK
jgi:hypothetical protein